MSTIINKYNFTKQLVQVLRYMEQLIVEETEDIRSGYTIIFQFKTNPFFENTEVSYFQRDIFIL